MSTLQCANIHFESTQNNRVQYLGSNNFAFVAGGSNVFVVNTTTSNITGNLSISGSISSNLNIINTNSIIVGNTVVNSTFFTLGNSTVNTFINSTTLDVTSNTGFLLGSFASTANGYTYLPNGLLINWGRVAAANTAAGTFATYSAPYTSATLAVYLTHQGTVRTVSPLVVSSNTTGANISSGIATTSGTNVYFIAIGV